MGTRPVSVSESSAIVEPASTPPDAIDRALSLSQPTERSRTKWSASSWSCIDDSGHRCVTCVRQQLDEHGESSLALRNDLVLAGALVTPGAGLPG